MAATLQAHLLTGPQVNLQAAVGKGQLKTLKEGSLAELPTGELCWQHVVSSVTTNQ